MPIKPLGPHITAATSGRSGPPDEKSTHLGPLAQTGSRVNDARTSQCWIKRRKDAAGAPPPSHGNLSCVLNDQSELVR